MLRPLFKSFVGDQGRRIFRLSSVISHQSKSIRLVLRTCRRSPCIVSPFVRSRPVQDSFRYKIIPTGFLLSGIFGFLNKKEVNEESELITIIKRAVLLIQHDEFLSAEQMLHVALKLAQEQQNADGITYIYDLLANLAFVQEQYTKAEYLFVHVMQRVMAGGVPEDDLKVNHMSLKLAKIYEEKKEFEKAEKGYKFCVTNLQNKIKDNPDDEDALTLWAMSLDWYARFLLDRERISEAFSYFQKAYDMSIKVNGEVHEQTVVLLNDLGTISFLNGNTEDAFNYLTKAVDIGKHLPNMNDFSSVYVNLGNIYLQKQMYVEAKRYCTEGHQNAVRHKNSEGIGEANLCLEELKKFMKD